MKITEKDIKINKSYYIKCQYSIKGGYRYYISFDDKSYKRIGKNLYDKISGIKIKPTTDNKFSILTNDNISII